MLHRWLCLMLCIAGMVMLSSCAQDYPAQNEPPGPGFQALFNGSDFTGWNFGEYNVEDTSWSIQDGVMYCAGEPRVPYLILTEKEYGNFEFYAEFKVSKGCNSGIFYHVPLAGRQSFLGFETQILDDAGTEPNKNSTGSIYDVVTPMVNAMKPAGVWNQYHVIIDWPQCRVWLNGTMVQDVDFSAVPRLKYRMLSGPLGLSNHGHEVWYRNLWIKELPDSDVWAGIFNGEDLTGWYTIGDADWHVEDGMLVSTKGEGYLVTEREFDRFYFQAYAENDTTATRDARFYYRFQSPENPGYRADLFDFSEAKRLTAQYGDKIPADVIRPQRSPLLLYRLVSGDRLSTYYLNEFPVSENKLLGQPPRGRIAIYRTESDGVLRFQRIKLRELEGPGI